MKENTISIAGKNMFYSGKHCPLGTLLVDFLILDLTEYEAKYQTIKKTLENKDIEFMQTFTKNFKPPKKLQRGYDGLAYFILDAKEEMSLEQKYTLFAVYKALHEIEHDYLDILNYEKIRRLESYEILKEFDLSSLQDEYKNAIKYCLLKDDTGRSAIERFGNYERSITGKAELMYYVEAGTLHEVFTASSISPLLYIEFMKMIQNNIFVSECKNCEKLFVPETKGNYDVKYCKRLIEGTTKTCEQAGAVNAFKTKITTDPVYKEYEKVYKRFYARKRKGIITQNQFDDWVKRCSKLKKEAVNGNLQIDDFKQQISKI